MQVFKSALAETKLQLSGLIRKLVALIGGVGLGLLALWALAGRQAMSDELVVTGAAAVGSVLLIVLQITFNVALAPYRSIKLRAESAEAALLDLKRSAEFVISFGAMGFNYKYSFHGRVLGFIHVKITNRGPNTCSATVKSVKLNIENKTFPDYPLDPPSEFCH